MSKDPDKRYQKAGDFARDIADVAAGRWYLIKITEPDEAGASEVKGDPTVDLAPPVAVDETSPDGSDVDETLGDTPPSDSGFGDTQLEDTGVWEPGLERPPRESGNGD
jgi:hypothetical protein